MYVLYKEKIIICVMQEKNSGPRACWVSTLTSLLKLRRKRGPKWPISINCRNIWPNSTVCEIIRHVPPFGVLELNELEYPIFFVHRGT